MKKIRNLFIVCMMLVGVFYGTLIAKGYSILIGVNIILFTILLIVLAIGYDNLEKIGNLQSQAIKELEKENEELKNELNFVRNKLNPIKEKLKKTK